MLKRYELAPLRSGDGFQLGATRGWVVLDAGVDSKQVSQCLVALIIVVIVIMLCNGPEVQTIH